MIPFTDPHGLLDRSLLGNLEASLPLPPPTPDFPLLRFPATSHEHGSSVNHAAPDHLLGIPPVTTPSLEVSPSLLLPPKPNDGAGSHRRRSVRNDRHSKIFTAKGLRDRRMRLSIDVARRFVDLQDMLGFDKASNTVEWLLSKSQSAIRELNGTSRSFPLPAQSEGDCAKGEYSSTSECEAISVSTVETTNAADPKENIQLCRVKRGAAVSPPRRTPNPPLSRETRMIARARARERTREKKLGQLLAPPTQLQMAGGDTRSHDLKFSPEAAADVLAQEISYLPEQHGTAVQQNSGRIGQISIFDYTQNVALDCAVGFVKEHWNMHLFGNFMDQSALLGDVTLQARPSEAFNNPRI